MTNKQFEDALAELVAQAMVAGIDPDIIIVAMEEEIATLDGQH